MHIIRGLHNLPRFDKGSVVSIGAFDGLHLGHQSLLQPLLKQARALAVPSVLITFEPLPREYFAPQNSPSRLMNFRDKAEACKAFGIDMILCLRFNEKMRAMSAMEFVEQVFFNGLHAKHITIGDDFKFGHDRSGDQQLLEKIHKRYDFELADTPSVVIDDLRISSSSIRKSLEAGDFELAQAMLGRPYTMNGKVGYGRQLGRTLGFPTANVQTKRCKSALSGVYVAKLSLPNGQCYNGVANVGTRPTIGDSTKALLEVHLFNFNNNIYGQRVSVKFLHKLRNEQKFESLASLKAAIANDAEQAKLWFEQAVTA